MEELNGLNTGFFEENLKFQNIDGILFLKVV